MMPADQLIIAIRRIIVRGGTVHDILRFLDTATDPDADLDVPLGEACRLDDDTCEACH